MNEADHFTSLGDIPDNISQMLTDLKELIVDFDVKVDICKDRYKIMLYESTITRGSNTSKCIVIEISENPSSYSIQLYNNYYQNSTKKDIKKIYEIEVEGENNFRLIKQDIKDLIEGKKKSPFSSNFPL